MAPSASDDDEFMDERLEEEQAAAHPLVRTKELPRGPATLRTAAGVNQGEGVANVCVPTCHWSARTSYEHLQPLPLWLVRKSTAWPMTKMCKKYMHVPGHP